VDVQEKSARQEEIITVALTLAAEKGVQELTIRNVAQAIGISEPAIYRHFTSKREILSGIIDMLVAIRKEAWEQSVTGQGDPVARLFRFFINQARQFERFPALAIILFPDELFRNDVELLNRVQEVMAATMQDIRELIAQARSLLLLKQDVDPYVAGLLLVGGFRLLVSSWRVEASRAGGVSLVTQVEEFLKKAAAMFA
jgi:AcrR family transcriptional regulator